MWAEAEPLGLLIIQKMDLNLLKITRMKHKKMKRDFGYVRDMEVAIKLCPFIFQTHNSAKIHHVLVQKANDTSVPLHLCLEPPLLLAFPLLL